MRNSILFSILCLASGASAFAQSINVTGAGVGIGTNTPASQLHVKDPSSTFTPEVSLARFDYYNGRFLNILGPLLDNSDSPFTIQTNNSLQFRVDSTDVMVIDFAGNVGIGTNEPSQKLTIIGSALIRGISFSTAGDSSILYFGDVSHSIRSVHGAGIRLSTYQVDNAMCIQEVSGNVGIGTIVPTHKLTVKGQVKSKGFVTDTSNWSDYVFQKDYKLPTLTEVEQHIVEKGHLPGIPSEKEVLANGVDLGDMQVRMLAQIEQLTLHMIAHQKAIDALQKENAELKRELKAGIKSSP